MQKISRTLLSLAAVSVLAGCSSMSSPQMSREVRNEAKQTVQALTESNNTVVESIVVQTPYIKGRVVDYVSPEKGSVNMTVSQQPMIAVFQSIAEQGKYNVTVASDVKTSTIVSVDLRNVTTEQALREVAAAGGYVAVFDNANKKVTLTETATFTFRLPERLFNDQLNGKFKMSNSPSGSSSTGSSITSTTSADVTGGTIKHDAKNLEKYIQQLAGKDAEVQVLADAGLITVRTKAQQLRRVHEALKDYARFALTQVELEVSMVEVSLADNTQSGVDWKKVFSVAGSPVSLNLSTSGAVGTPTASLQYTGASVTSLVNALEKVSNARTLASQRFPAFNNTLSMMFDGKQVPYVGKVQQSVSGNSGTATTTGEYSYAMDGVSTAVYTNVIDNNQVELTLMPVLSSISGFDSTTISGNVLKAPIQPLRQGHFPFIGRHGMTMVFGGGRYGKESLDKSGLPGITGTALNTLAGGNNKVQEQKELVFLVSTKIIPMPKFEPLVRESL